ncbi:rCG60170 [Rattus norvegicus]|uniref:RCG60170 n=1 Tax=Rattus norvegicus TaxID=10116 RepID=A6HTE5_RAT|nr:rCG60170 [Rattus norvegicus]
METLCGGFQGTKAPSSSSLENISNPLLGSCGLWQLDRSWSHLGRENLN